MTIQPIVFTLLFLYVFGSSIHTNIPYKDYLLPGLLGQGLAFGVIGAGVPPTLCACDPRYAGDRNHTSCQMEKYLTTSSGVSAR